MEILVNVFDRVVSILVWSVRVDCRGRVKRVRFFLRSLCIILFCSFIVMVIFQYFHQQFFFNSIYSFDGQHIQLAYLKMTYSNNCHAWPQEE